jgi:8-oxo-dGTP diphosphatase
MSIVKNHFRTILTTRLLLECNDNILFLKQTPLNGGGFTLPGGKIEHSEFAKEALIREVFEEIDIVLTKKALQLVHVTHRKRKNMSEIILFFHCVAKPTIEPIAKEVQKFENAVWLSANDIPDELTGVLKRGIAAIKKGKVFTEFPKPKIIDTTVDNVPIIAIKELEKKTHKLKMA